MSISQLNCEKGVGKVVESDHCGLSMPLVTYVVPNIQPLLGPCSYETDSIHQSSLKKAPLIVGPSALNNSACMLSVYTHALVVLITLLISL